MFNYREKQFSMQKYLIAFNLCKLKWEETEQSSGNSFLFECLNICIFLLKIFDYVAVENTFKAAQRLLQFIMFKTINSTICKIFFKRFNGWNKGRYRIQRHGIYALPLCTCWLARQTSATTLRLKTESPKYKTFSGIMKSFILHLHLSIEEKEARRLNK